MTGQIKLICKRCGKKETKEYSCEGTQNDRLGNILHAEVLNNSYHFGWTSIDLFFEETTHEGECFKDHRQFTFHGFCSKDCADEGLINWKENKTHV